MAKRQQVTKLLAVMAMTASPVLASPDHAPPRAPAPAPAAAHAPAPRPDEGPAPAARPAPPPPQAAPATPAPAAAAPVSPALQVLMVLFGIARPRELPNGRPAPGNVASRAASRGPR